ncbi:MAG: fumarylacetoacetate hydrolase family protein [Saprospiraceae bacterium]|jgi:acylpyruvate hydrolase
MKIICIGRNYSEHARELNNAVPEEPVVFMKPPSALLVNDKPLYYPEFTSDLHYEGEVVLQIGKNGRHIQPEFASGYIGGIGFGIDFTARDLQQKCKSKGLPWEIAKAFDGSAPLSAILPTEQFPDLAAINFELYKNGARVQQGNTRDMIFSFEDILVYVSRFFKLQMGDLIFTGTPAGVGPVGIGDKLEGFLHTREGRLKMLECAIK